MLLDTSVC